MGAERAAVPELQARVAQPLARQRRRDVALAVAGGDEHERDDVDGAGARGGEPVNGVLDRRRGELEEPALHVDVGQPLRHPLDELGELRAALLALGPVSDDEQSRSHSWSSR